MGIVKRILIRLLVLTYLVLTACSKEIDPTTYIYFNPLITYGNLIDIEDNSYKTVTIGTQVWMAENLKSTKYNDGLNIPLVAKNEHWSTLDSPGYCWYDNHKGHKPTYGALYNWYAVNTNKLCPTGWHVPTKDDWTILHTYLGGVIWPGIKLKEAGTSHWNYSDKATIATNESGFTALPGGLRNSLGEFYHFRNLGLWWSSTELISGEPWCFDMSYDDDNAYLDKGFVENTGFSVRCIKNK